ncbi:leucine-rich repeat-containing protein 15-like [Prorops nasuta]|uniref:leucine-rich repeat-containing protein 15-like n=1 Tax=Prorops nasuta TaxID=863751 RepID=UPI0034CFB10E
MILKLQLVNLKILVLDGISESRGSLDIDFVNLLNLKHLFLRRNNFIDFNYHKRGIDHGLTHLYLSENYLTVANSSNLPNSLAHLDLSSNQLRDVMINDLSSLIFLDISRNNEILHICTDCDRFSIIAYPIERDEFGSPVKRYSSFNSKNLFSLKHLNASYNKIESVDTDSFIDTYNLVTLDLSSNRIDFLEQDVFKNLSALRYLYINNNQLTYTPNVCDLINLEILNLSGNRISIVSSNAFHGLSKLTILYLNTNKINCIKDNAFESLISLKVLDLSENVLHTLPENWIPPQNKLGTLILENNQFNSLSDIQFTNVESLKDLYIYNNPFQVSGNLHLRSLIDLPPNVTLHLELKSVNTIHT